MFEIQSPSSPAHQVVYIREENLPGKLESVFSSSDNEIHILTRKIVMKVFAIGSFAKPITDEERQRIMQKEVPTHSSFISKA